MSVTYSYREDRWLARRPYLTKELKTAHKNPRAKNTRPHFIGYFEDPDDASVAVHTVYTSTNRKCRMVTELGNNVTFRNKKRDAKWKLWRNKQTTRWKSFGSRLSKRALFKDLKELGWDACKVRISLLSSIEPGILITVLLHDEWFKCNKKIVKMHSQQKRLILIR